MFEFIKMYEDVEIPQYETSKSSGLDLKAYLKIAPFNDRICINPHHSAIIPTGLKIQMNLDSIEAQIRGRSSLAAKYNIFVLNSPGTVDEDYLGEIKIILFNLSDDLFVVHHGDRVAQIVFNNIIRNPNYVKETIRGEGGFGSTGK